MQWTAAPLWSRSHEHTSSLCAMISGGGRVFYVYDDGLTSVTDERLPERWTLVARDAFNGLLLWERPLPEWRGDEWKSRALRGRPASVPRRIVAGGDLLYATLSHSDGLRMLDAATGETIETIDGTETIVGTEGTQEILLRDDRILVLRLAPTGKEGKGRGGSVAMVSTDLEQIRWQVPTERYVPQSLAASCSEVVYSNGTETVCLSIGDGKEIWRAANPRPAPKRGGEKTYLLHGRSVLEGGNAGIIARDASTGEIRWTARTGGASMRPHDLFVARGLVWHASSDGITGYDLVTGEPVQTIDPSSVQSAGHHLRCYRAKATERFLITQFRGAEFVSLTDAAHCQNDWIRGACRYGVMPANGLLYVPPNPCFCYPGAKLTGLLALAPRRDEGRGPRGERDGAPRLHRGPAHGQVSKARSAIINHQSSIINPPDWPTYRRDARRSGATPSKVGARVSLRWEAALDGRLTPPVVARGRVYVAVKDEQTLYALGVDDGRELWHFAAGGRIDSPPTVVGELVLFGCADGEVYCLRASDGALAWRLRAAPDERLIVAFNRLESAWRVHGSVLPHEGLVYCTAGRSSFLDGGISILAIEPATGRVAHQRQIDTWSPTRDDAEGKPFIPSYVIEGTHSDVLVSQGGSIFLGQMKFDSQLARQDAPYLMPDPENPVVAMDILGTGFTANDPDLAKGFESFRGFHHYLSKAHPELVERYKKAYGAWNLGDRKTGPHLSATAGFLDDSWFNRTFWMYSTVWPGWYHAHRGAKCGQLVVVGDKRTYAVQAFPTRNRQSPLFTPGEKGYLLLADENDTEPILDEATRGATKGMGYTRLRPPVWYDWVPIRIRGMVLAGEHLFVAGPPDVVDPDDPMAAFEGRKGAVLRAYSAADGKTLAEQRIEAPPVFDGLIAAAGRLFLSTTDGRVVCLGQR
jgi:outer membrane protein assembly factor BamB